MSRSRFRGRNTFVNGGQPGTEEAYEELRESRNRKRIKHFVTAEMRYPDEALRRRLAEVEYVWSHGDKYWKLAAHYYGDSRYWWIIAWYNLKPTDAHCRIGDRLKIPMPLNKILKYYGY
tara:strand:- start:1338 stop:1694 length:357 start_codon:yes stop_codon:yes gene_type:complete